MNTPPEKVVPGTCNITALRKAARRLTRFYDACLADTGIRSTQYAILSLLASRGPVTMATLAESLSMDRATMGHNLRPLERDGLIHIRVGQRDRREREVTLSARGAKQEAQCRTSWNTAQTGFEDAFGKTEALAMRRMMAHITALDLPDGRA
jgi:DNA-binding MarR family transcriptional regulator